MAIKRNRDDMSEYIDSKGKVYKLQGVYTNGDLVILSDNGEAWKLSSAILAECRDMLANGAGTTKEVIIPDANNIDLALFVFAISQKPLFTGLDFYLAKPCIALLRRYECDVAAERLLYHSVAVLNASELFDAFVLASQFNHIMSATRILAQGYKWYKPDALEEGAPLCPDSSRHPWKPAEAMQIRSDWMWSLTFASMTCKERHHGKNGGFAFSSPKYWQDLVGVFMSTLAR